MLGQYMIQLVLMAGFLIPDSVSLCISLPVVTGVILSYNEPCSLGVKKEKVASFVDMLPFSCYFFMFSLYKEGNTPCGDVLSEIVLGMPRYLFSFRS